MRVSSTMMTGNYMKQLQRSYKKQADLMEQGDGQRIHRPSDDPVAFVRSMTFKNSLSENEQYTQNLGDAVSWMKTSDGAMVDMTEIMKTLTERITDAATDTNTQADREKIAQEIEGLLEQLVTLGNTQLGDRYVFAGQSDKVQPFTIGEVTAKGDVKTLDDKQVEMFGVKQMMQMEDEEGNTFYWDFANDKIYTQDYVDSGYKEVLSANANKTAAEQQAAVQAGNMGKLYEGSPDRVMDLDANQEDYFGTDEIWRITDPWDSTRVSYWDAKNNLTYDASTYRAEFTTGQGTPAGTNPGGAQAAAVSGSNTSTSVKESMTQAQKDAFGTDNIWQVKDAWGNVTGYWDTDHNLMYKKDFFEINNPLNMNSYAGVAAEVGRLNPGVTGAELQKLIQQEIQTGNDPMISTNRESGKSYNKSQLTLNSEQKEAFGTDEIWVMTNPQNTETYYWDAKNDKVYTADYFTSGYKDTVAENSGKSKSQIQTAVRKNALGGMTNSLFNTKGQVEDGRAVTNAITVNGQTLHFTTSDKTVVVYTGDDKKISMPIQNGDATPDRDSVNATGGDVFGIDAFGGYGASILNDMYEVCRKMRADDGKWLSGDGVQLANYAYDQVLSGETELAARTQTYNQTLETFEKQNTIITSDITDASATNIASLSVELLTAQTLYNMSLSLGAKILPQSLTDYL